jgi:predicted Zn-dependent peptidase
MNVSRYELQNGAEWIAVHDPQEPHFPTFFYARMGTEKEDKNHIEGMHLLEHMFFRGKNLADSIAIAKALEERRVSSNGTTSKFYCSAYFHGPTRVAGHRDNVKEMIRSAHEALTRQEYDPYEFRLEKEIVRQELERDRDANVWLQLEELMDQRLYGSTRYGRTTDESISSLRRLTLTQVIALRDRLFRPQNLTLVTVGSKKDGDLERVIQETFGCIPPAAKPLIQYPFQPPPREAFTEIIPKSVCTCFVQQAIRGCQPDAEKLAVLHVLNSVLTPHDTSLLYERLRMVRGQTFSPTGIIDAGRPEFRLDITYNCDERYLNDTPQREGNLSLVRQTLERLATELLPQSDLRRLRNLAAEDFKETLHQEADVCGEWYGENSAAGIFYDHREFAKALMNVTARQVRNAMRDWLPGMGTIAFVPDGTRQETGLSSQPKPL